MNICPELLECALELLRVPRDQRDRARKWVRSVAIGYAASVSIAEDESTMRISDSKKSLTKLAEHAREIANILQEIPLKALIYAYGAWEDWDKTRRFLNDVYDENKLAQHIERLNDFATLAERLRKRMPPDQGGRRTLRTQLALTSKELLALSCLELFWHFRPDQKKGTEATKGENGDYAALVRTVYEIATGREADADRAGLQSYVEKIVPQFNKLVRAKGAFAFQKPAPNESPVGLICRSPDGLRFFDKPTNLIDDIVRSAFDLGVTRDFDP